MSQTHNYEALRELARGCTLPAMFVDVAAFDRNAKRFVEIARQRAKTIRVATKSLRVPALLRRFQEIAGETAQGWMCYSVAEAHFLAGQGFDDLLVAYPHTQSNDVRLATELAEQGKTVTLMIDCPKHVEILAGHISDSRSDGLRVCVDVDASLKKFGQHLGAQRSPLRSIDQLRGLLESVQQTPQLVAVGAMTYEAQVAGLADQVPRQGVKNAIIRRIKGASMQWLGDYRAQIRDTFEKAGIEMTVFNGGGSGSFAETASDPSLTEVTVGSGLLQSHLFDNFEANQSEPALFFALPITRTPQPNIVTCQSGGFIASGSPGSDRQPIVYHPKGLAVEAREGFGEVQTPFVVSHEWRGKLGIGAPIFFRPAKSGEIAERFDEYHLAHGDTIEEQVKTYRGLGQCFF